MFSSKTFRRIQDELGNLSPDHRAYVNAMQEPSSNAQIYHAFAESGQLNPDLIARAMAKAKNADLASVEDINAEQAIILGSGYDGVIVYGNVAYMVNPFDPSIRNELQKRLETGDISYHKTGVISLNAFNDPKFTGGMDQAENDADSGAELELSEEGKKIEAERLISNIIHRAFKQKATDIHIAGSTGGGNRTGDVRIRVDGKLRPLMTFDTQLYRSMSAVLHEKTKTQIKDPSKPHSADLEYTLSDGKPLTIRLESIEHQAGRKFWRKISLRIMGAGGSFSSIKAIGFAEEDESRLHSVTRRPNGLFLVTGPTGSGKSTTLGSIISTMYMAQPDRAYYSIEHPVEVEHNGVWQIPIKGNLTFEEALESCMRNDPDVILVGEIRSKKTAELAIQAALTGHVVLATLHTNDSHGVIPRLKHFGVTSVDLAECLIGSCAQRLVPTLCVHCCDKRPFGEVKAKIRETTPAVDSILPEWISDDHEIGVRRDGGCVRCSGSGVHGRTAVFESFLSNGEVREELLDGQSGIQMRRAHLQSKHITPLWMDGIRKLKLGKVSLEELFRILDESDLQDLASFSQ